MIEYRIWSRPRLLPECAVQVKRAWLRRRLGAMTEGDLAAAREAAERLREPSVPLAQLDAFQRFQADIRERCEEPPAASDLRRIGSYRL